MNILICGVGGQGTLLASRILGNYARLTGMDCKLSEVHGMAQRGGSVVTHVKMAKKVYSPLVAEGSADFVLAFEELEALRAALYLKTGGKMIVNAQQIMPLPVIIGAAQYPADVFGKLDELKVDYVKTDAIGIALKCGNSKSVNTVMLGALSKIAGLDYELVKKALELSVKPKFLELNLNALEAGYNAGTN